MQCWGPRASNQPNSLCPLPDSIYYLLNNYLIWKVFLNVEHTPLPEARVLQWIVSCVFRARAGPEHSCPGCVSARGLGLRPALPSRVGRRLPVPQDTLANSLITGAFFITLLKASAGGWASRVYLLFSGTLPLGPLNIWQR